MKVAASILVVLAACGSPPVQPPRAATPYQDPCTDERMKEQECALPDGRHGWCGVRKCDDICGPDATYTHMSTSCVKPCGPACKTCNPEFGLCVDDSPYGTEVVRP